MDEVCRVCGLPTYLSVDKCPYCGEKYGNRSEINGLYSNERSIVTSVYNRIANDNKYNNVIVHHKLAKCCTVNELRKLCGLKDI